MCVCACVIAGTSTTSTVSTHTTSRAQLELNYNIVFGGNDILLVVSAIGLGAAAGLCVLGVALAVACCLKWFVARSHDHPTNQEDTAMALNDLSRPHLRAEPHDYVSLTEQRMHNIQVTSSGYVTIGLPHFHRVSAATISTLPLSDDQTEYEASLYDDVTTAMADDTSVAMETANIVTVAVEMADSADVTTETTDDVAVAMATVEPGPTGEREATATV